MAAHLLASIETSGWMTWQQVALGFVTLVVFGLLWCILVPYIAEEVDPNDENF